MADLKSMMLVTVPYTPQEKSFRMIPVTNDCPYIDVVYWKDKKVLEINTAFKRNEYAYYPKLDDNGDMEKRKHVTKDEQGNDLIYKQERRITEVLQKYYIIEQVEIMAFIESFAINSKTVDYMSILAAGPIVEAPKTSIIMP
jgi:predicted lipase